MWWWKLLFISRFLFTLLPQSGYVHPDEFFQSVEPVIGDILGFQTYQPWELTLSSTQEPIRSIVIPYILVGIPIYVLRFISKMSEMLFEYPLLTPYTLLVIPRLVMTSISGFGDTFLYHICKMNKRNHRSCLLVYASSYVTMVYMTRTLSNSIESTLFASVLYITAKHIHFWDQLVTFRRKQQKTTSDSYPTDCNKLAVLLTVGIFNRPTFVLYALVPVFVWLTYPLNLSPKNVRNVLKGLLSLLPGMAITSLFFIFADSLYFGSFDFDLLHQTDLIITPLNFVRYNINTKNLQQHGLHPRYLHMIVNVPLLFGAVGIGMLVWFLKLSFIYLPLGKRFKMYAIDKVMLCSFIMPLLLLTLVPHQEPRFLLGLLLPLTFLGGEGLFGRTTVSRLLLVSWIVGNFLGGFFYGVIHQGGVTWSLMNLRNQPLTTSGKSYAIFYHTYMPPRFLLLNSKEQLYNNEILISDLMGANVSVLQEEVQKLCQLKSDIFIVTPTSLQEEVNLVLQSYNTELKSRYYWHFSMEDPPPLNASFFNKIGMDIYSIKCHALLNS